MRVKGKGDLKPPTLLRLPAVLARTGRSRSSLYEDIHNGIFVRQVPIGPRAVGWLEHEVAELLMARARGDSTEQLKKLVKELHSKRRL